MNVRELREALEAFDEDMPVSVSLSLLDRREMTAPAEELHTQGYGGVVGVRRDSEFDPFPGSALDVLVIEAAEVAIA